MEEILNQITGWSLFGFTMIDIVAVIFALVFNVTKTNRTLKQAIELLGKKELPKEIELDIKEHISSETRQELAEVKSLLKASIKAESYILQTFKAKNWLNGNGIPKAEIDAFLDSSDKPSKAVIKLVDRKEPADNAKIAAVTKRKTY